ncbi:DUF1990 family protein [Salininema proteolyticum]|uniref:DUF1990 family protein n=1 Tax=Salininema proteolyticum TaxID=1607685 RepID=A0ABV8U0K2_9ACTN
MNPETDPPLTYPEVGATRQGTMPAGYRHLDVTGEIPAPLSEAAAYLLTWELHRDMGFRPDSAAVRAAEGAKVVLRLGPLTAPCRVVWAADGPREAGFAYGGLPGHPEKGEALFLLEEAGAERTRFTVRSFSRPGTVLTRVTAPASRLVQRRLTRRFVAVMRKRFTAGAG